MNPKIRYRLCYRRSGRLNKRGEGLVQIECQQQGRRIYFSTHTYLRPEQWGAGCVVGTGNADALNYALYRQIEQVEAVELDYIRRGVNVTLPLLREAVRSNTGPAATLMDFGTQVIAESDRKHYTRANYESLLRNVERFRRGTLVSDIDYPWVCAYDRWLSKQGIAHNTRVSRLKLLRALVNEARRREMVSQDPFDRFRIPGMVAKRGYLTEEQVRTLELMDLHGATERARDAFLIGCWTGLRFSDICALRQHHIKDGWLTIKMKKTGGVVDIPVRDLFDGRFMRLVDKYQGDIGRLTAHLGENGQTNALLKPLLNQCECSDNITFHSSRHTFATLLGQRGIDIGTVQQLLGHEKLQTTQIYYEKSRRTLAAGLQPATRRHKRNKKHK